MLVNSNSMLDTKNYRAKDLKTENLIISPSKLQAELPNYTHDVIESLLNIKRGPVEGSMETLGLIKSVRSNEVYQINERTIKISTKLFAINLEHEASNPPIISVPDHLEFKAEWNKLTIASGEGNNILGDNGGLFFEETVIRVPKVKATKEALAYYGALLIPQNTAIRFPDAEPYPLWKMYVGANYVRDYIMDKNGGGGFYLEFHHDQPHFHLIVDGGGYYLLAKQIKEDIFHITAFEVSNGQAIYTKKGAIHCDAALTGDLVVGYTASKDCSTVLLRSKVKNEMVEVEFI
ncbi:MAG: hypothetical protein H0V82_03035 [Candidatus Protochlamydia sp.]|nr:hypothetical protein [Candidatus Protochlamydia sp.]